MKPQSWDEVLATHTPEVQAAARALEAVLREALPDAAVQFDPGNGLLAFGRSMKMRELIGVTAAGPARLWKVAPRSITKWRLGSLQCGV